MHRHECRCGTLRARATKGDHAAWVKIGVVTGAGDRLRGAFCTALGVDPSCDFEQLAYAETKGWDSVAHMSLVAEIEAAFDIMLPTEDVIAMSTFPKAREIVSKHGVRF